MHGYNPEKVPEVLPFFIAAGPVFKKAYVKDSFHMVDIYPLMCHILKVRPAINRGSLDNVKDLLINPPVWYEEFETTAISCKSHFGMLYINLCYMFINVTCSQNIRYAMYEFVININLFPKSMSRILIQQLFYVFYNVCYLNPFNSKAKKKNTCVSCCMSNKNRVGR